MKAIGTMKIMAITTTTVVITIVANPGHSVLQTEEPSSGSFVLRETHSSVRIRCG
jgi:hypothetical protein